MRPSIRNNSEWHKDSVIKLVASVVGPDHTVDLENYDLLILVNVVQVGAHHHGLLQVARSYQIPRKHANNAESMWNERCWKRLR